MLSRGVLAKIHIAKKDLGLPDDIYRDVLHVQAGVESAKDLDPAGAEKVLQHFQSLGWVARPRRATPSPLAGEGAHKRRYDDLGNRPGMASPKQLRMLEATWNTHPRIREKTSKALRAFLARRFRIADLRFVEGRDVGKILKAIKSIK